MNNDKKKTSVSKDLKSRRVRQKKKRSYTVTILFITLLVGGYLFIKPNLQIMKSVETQASIDLKEKPSPIDSIVVELGENSESMKLSDFHAKIIDKYCIDCHDSVSEEGGVNLEGLSLNVGQDIQTAEMWDHVLNAVNSGEMPPKKKKKQLPTEEKKAFLKDLSKAMVFARRKLSDRSGEVTMRRLNRRESVNSLKDLLGFEPQKDTYLVLPKDEDLDGFDTNGNSLYFSSHQFELYRKVAKDALLDMMSLYGVKKPPVKVVRTEQEGLVRKKYQQEYDKLAARVAKAKEFLKGEKDTKVFDKKAAKDAQFYYSRFAGQYKEYLQNKKNDTGQTLLVFKFHDAAAASHKFWPKTGGKYIIRYRLGTINNPEEGYKYVTTPAGYRKVTGTYENPQILTIEKELRPTKGKMHFEMKVRNPHSRSQRWNLFMDEVKKNGTGPTPHIWVDWVEVEGPIHEKWPPYNISEIIGQKNSGEDHYSHVRRILANFAEKAFRGKKPEVQYIDNLVQLYKDFGGNEKSFKTTIVEPLAIILASPSFLYIAEPVNKETEKQVSDRELAIRLASFLWSSPPDQELLSLAGQGLLSKPEILKQQTDRLLKDPQAEAFIRGFTYQWLGMRDVDTFQFDAKDFPHFDENIRTLAKEEVYQSVQNILTKNESLENLLNPDYVMVNERLADYYGLPNVNGPEFRPVTVNQNSPRGGLLGMAAFHILGSDGKETNLVKRGAWVLSHLLNNPPPPPPADVLQLSRFAGEGPFTARDLLKLHSEEPQCAQCHDTIDPVGYGLENFDASGIWREQEVHIKAENAKSKKKKKSAKVHTVTLDVNPSGSLPNGAKFNNYFEMREAIASQSSKFSRGFTEALISYALARDFSFVDEEMANELQQNAQSKDNTISAYIHGLVQSQAFKTKRGNHE